MTVSSRETTDDANLHARFTLFYIEVLFKYKYSTYYIFSQSSASLSQLPYGLVILLASFALSTSPVSVLASLGEA